MFKIGKLFKQKEKPAVAFEVFSKISLDVHQYLVKEMRVLGVKKEWGGGHCSLLIRSEV